MTDLLRINISESPTLNDYNINSLGFIFSKRNKLIQQLPDYSPYTPKVKKILTKKQKGKLTKTIKNTKKQTTKTKSKIKKKTIKIITKAKSKKRRGKPKLSIKLQRLEKICKEIEHNEQTNQNRKRKRSSPTISKFDILIHNTNPSPGIQFTSRRTNSLPGRGSPESRTANCYL